MEAVLNNYLTKTDKYLKTLPESERIDILKEIKSDMIELENGGISSEQIIERLGPPKELASAYIGDSITKSNSFNFRKFISVLTFSGYAGFIVMFILPLVSIVSIALQFSGIIAPLAGIIKLIGSLLGYDVPFVVCQFGTYSASPLLCFIFSIIIGAILFIIGKFLWKLTIFFVKSLSKSKERIL